MRVTSLLQEAMDALGFNDDEKYGMYRGTAAVLQMGEMKFKQRPREEQADADGMTGERGALGRLWS